MTEPWRGEVIEICELVRAIHNEKMPVPQLDAAREYLRRAIAHGREEAVTKTIGGGRVVQECTGCGSTIYLTLVCNECRETGVERYEAIKAELGTMIDMALPLVPVDETERCAECGFEIDNPDGGNACDACRDKHWHEENV